MTLLSVQVGKPREVSYRGKPVTTGIFKNPIQGPVMLRALGLDGDGQADLSVHGGRDKAVYAYSDDAYPLWQALRPGNTFGFGATGENLSVDVLPEAALFVGDTYELGGAVIQVAQPRLPCHKLAVKFDDPGILKQFMALGRPGVYFRVLQEGLIEAGNTFKLVEQESTRLSIAELFALARDPGANPVRIREILEIGALPENWREQFRSLL
jgi:MOSC domain-containing protein YiiM